MTTPTPTPASFETIAAQKKGLIRKPLRGTQFLGKVGVAPVITTLVAPNGQILMPKTYESCGWLTEDGTTYSRDRSFSEIRGWGATTVLRRDITADNWTVQFSAMETKRLTRELKLGIDLSGTQMSAAGEWKAEIPDRPDVMHWRSVTLAKDGSGATLFYIARVLHNTTVTDVGDETWSDGDNGLYTDVTLAAEPDDETGTIGTEFLFGPGALAAAEDMGFTVAAA